MRIKNDERLGATPFSVAAQSPRWQTSQAAAQARVPHGLESGKLCGAQRMAVVGCGRTQRSRRRRLTGQRRRIQQSAGWKGCCAEYFVGRHDVNPRLSERQRQSRMAAQWRLESSELVTYINMAVLTTNRRNLLNAFTSSLNTRYGDHHDD